MFEIDELTLYRGRDIQITPKIIVIQPTLDQIERYGEKNYFSAVHTLTAVGADFKWQLWDYYNTDYTKIEDYDLFISLIVPALSSKKRILELWKSDPEQYKEELSKLDKDDEIAMLRNPLELILKDIDFADFIPCKTKNDEIVLFNVEREITIDRMIYSQIVDVVRRIHGLKRNNQLPGNERTKRDLIDDARDDYMKMQRMPYRSLLLSLISALTVKSGMCGDDRIWNMGICMFFDNIKRAGRIQDAELLLQGAYSGFASLKGIDKTRLDWTGDL